MMGMNMILLWSCGLYLIFSEAIRNKNHLGKIAVNILLSAIFLVVISLVSYIAHRNGYSNMVAVISLLLAMTMLGIRLVKVSGKSRHAAFPLILLFFWLVAMLYVTMVSRLGEEAGPDVSINPILAIKELLGDGSRVFVKHAILNVLMFIPLGCALRLLDSEKKLRLRWFFVGAIVSSSVEMVQLMFSLGQCDIMDIISNSLGNIIGFLLTHIFLWGAAKIKGK